MCAKAMPVTVYVAVRRHLSEAKLCARARAGSLKVARGGFCKVWMGTAGGGRRTAKKQYKKCKG